MPQYKRIGEPGRSPLSAAIGSGNLYFISGQVPITNEGHIPVGIADQTRLVMDKLSELVTAAGGDMSNIIKTTVFLTSKDNFAVMNEVYKSYFKDGEYPARSTIECNLMVDVLIEIEAIAII